MSSKNKKKQTEKAAFNPAIAAKKLDLSLEKMADKPAGRITGRGTDQQAASATGVPGYYHTQNSQKDTKLMFRIGAAKKS